jgi:hypothetical protein
VFGFQAGGKKFGDGQIVFRNQNMHVQWLAGNTVFFEGEASFPVRLKIVKASLAISRAA